MDPFGRAVRPTGMGFDAEMPFRGSDAVRAGQATWGVLNGPGFRRVGVDTYVASPATGPLLDIRAATTRAGPSAVVTGWSACRVLGLDVARGPKPVELSVPDRRLRDADGTAVGRQRFADDEVITRAEMRVTTPLRTAFDLATRSGPLLPAIIDRGFDPLTDAVVAADALARQGGFTAADLTAFAGRHRGARGTRRVATVAALLDPRADSPPETRTRVKIVLAGLPRPVVRLELRDEIGQLIHELDLAWPRYRVAVEYDGRDHARDDRRWRDVDRLDALRRDRWEIITVTSRQLARPLWVPRRVGEALMERGWVPDPDTEWASIMVNRAR